LIKRKNIPYLIAGIFILFVWIWHYYVDKEKEKLLQNSASTHATIINFTNGGMGKNYINYEYVVDKDTFFQSTYIREKFVDENLVGTTDLKIRYATNDHSISEIIDPRFK